MHSDVPEQALLVSSRTAAVARAAVAMGAVADHTAQDLYKKYTKKVNYN